MAQSLGSYSDTLGASPSGSPFSTYVPRAGWLPDCYPHSLIPNGQLEVPRPGLLPTALSSTVTPNRPTSLSMMQAESKHILFLALPTDTTRPEISP